MYSLRIEWLTCETNKYREIISFVDSRLDATFKDCGVVCQKREQTCICQIIPRWVVEFDKPCTSEQQKRLRRALERMVKRKRYRFELFFVDPRGIRFELVPQQFRQIIGHFLHIRSAAEAGCTIVPKRNWRLSDLLGYEISGTRKLSDGDDQRQPIEQYISLAEYGYYKVQMQLAYDYQHGLGHIACNETEAARWYRRAAERDCAEGQYQLALCYEKGRGVARNYAEAAKWYHRAAEQKHVGSSRKLGAYYRCGYGVGQNDTLAVQYFRKYRFFRFLRKIGLGCPAFHWPHWDNIEI